MATSGGHKTTLRGRHTLKRPCLWHKPNRLPYVAWHEWAEAKAGRGHQQRRCPDCQRFFFKCEWGSGRPWPRKRT